MVLCGALIDGGQRGVVQADWDNARWTVADGLAAAAAERGDVIASLRFIGPRLDLLVVHRDAVDLLHLISVIRNRPKGKLERLRR